MAVTSVVIVTQLTTVTASPTSSILSSTSSSNLSTGVIAGITVGVLLGGILIIGLTFFLLLRCKRHKFTKVVNPGHDDTERAFSSKHKSKRFARHSQRPSVSSQPLMSPASYPSAPSTSRVLSPTRLDSVLPEIRHSAFTLGAFGELNPVVASDNTIPPMREEPPPSLRAGSNDTPPQTPRTLCDDTISPPTPTKSARAMFLHRMLKSRAQASENDSFAGRSSLPFSPSRSGTLDSSTVHGDEERLLAEAEQSALRDAEARRRGEAAEMLDGEDSWEEVESTESMYSQGSAPPDHAGFLSDNGTLSVVRRGSSRRRARTPVPAGDLSLVTEVPDTPRGMVGRSAGTPSIDGRVSAGTADEAGAHFPLLTSTNFGKESTASASLSSSSAGWGSSGSGRTSRYPSLAASSLGMASQCGPGPDWHHPPPGLAGLTSLRVGPLENPHSPVEEREELREALAARVKRAHLREGTVMSLTSVERRDVLHGGIADIDVAL